MFFVNQAAKVGALMSIHTVKFPRGFHHFFLEGVFNAFVHKHKIRCDTGLARVHHFTGQNTLHCDIELGIGMNDSGAFTAQL